MTALQILAIMVAMLTPGGSAYSQVPVARDAVTACPKHLTKFSPLCRPPRPNDHWGRGAWTRAENRSEALVRWHGIAKVIEAVAAKPPKGWRGTSADLAATIIAITRNESGWRRDVHAGKGARAYGDAGKSGCLGQVMRVRRRWRSPRGYKWRSLMGLGVKPTTRCVQTIADYLARVSSKVCGKSQKATCWFSGYGGGVKASDPRIRARMASLAFARRGAPKLSESDLKTIGR